MSDSPKKVVLAYAYGTTNAGDHALTLGALRLLQEVDAPVEISVISRYSRHQEPSEATRDIAKKFPDVNTVPSPFAFSRSSALTRVLEKVHGFLLVAFVFALPHIALSFLRHNEALMEIADADLVLCNGGNLFYWNRHRKSLPRLIALAFPMMIARRLGKAYAFLPQTMGPFEGKVPEMLFRDLFEQSEFLLFREPISKGHAASIADLDTTRTAVVPDLAFVSPPSPKSGGETDQATTPDAKQNPFIAVTLRASQLGDPEVAKDQSVNESATRRVANYMRDVVLPVAKSHDLDVKVVVQTTNDEEVSRRFADLCEEELGQRVITITERRPQRLSDLYEDAELLVGMRLHSMIFALRRDTPVMGIYLEHFGPKIEGTLQMFGLDDYSILLTDVDPEESMQALENLFRERAQLRKEVSKKRKEYIRLETEVLEQALQAV
ncbi:polysaccharide pyruvyl transferase family protein [Salinibacter sp.]|uniref:polysaccharide pyruvyl transferase family protein n=1 Tax=Salinibacter sp. TaxID=2065818 RepID=UPI0021E82641|nr:polysaccharide pyruvyl transferase family protein [Salinibacter sp.]